MKTVLKLAALLEIAVLGLGAGHAALADDTAAAESGVWQKHVYSFAFFGFTSTYSCDGLADKLKLLLIASGARKDVKAYSGGCPQGFGRPDKLARADLTFYTLAAPGADDAGGAPVQGVWKTVKLSQRSPWDLGLGDCELVEQFRDQLLPMFTTRNRDDHTTCVPHQLSGSSFSLNFEALTGVPAKAAGARTAKIAAADAKSADVAMAKPN